MYWGVSKVLLPLYLSDCISVTLYHRYRTASVARTLSARLRSESLWLMKEVNLVIIIVVFVIIIILMIDQVGSATARAQQDSNFRLEEKLRDTNQWRAELQGEVDRLDHTYYGLDHTYYDDGTRANAYIKDSAVKIKYLFLLCNCLPLSEAKLSDNKKNLNKQQQQKCKHTTITTRLICYGRRQSSCKRRGDSLKTPLRKQNDLWGFGILLNISYWSSSWSSDIEWYIY